MRLKINILSSVYLEMNFPVESVMNINNLSRPNLPGLPPQDQMVVPLIDVLTLLYCTWKIQKNWYTVTVAPTKEHHGGHSRTPANQRWDQVRKESASPAWLATPAMNARDTTKVYIWRLDTGCGPTLYTCRKCHSHNTPGKKHNNNWVEPLAGNCIKCAKHWWNPTSPQSPKMILSLIQRLSVIRKARGHGP